MTGLSSEAIARMHAAARAIRDGAVGNAQGLLHLVLASAPGHPEALRLLGILHTRNRRPDLALSTFQQALVKSPDDAVLLNDLGSAQAACGEHEAALATWRRACTLAPEAPTPWFNLGRNLQLQGASQAAAEALQRACALASDLLPASILLGDVLVHLGRLDDAAARYRAALALDPACGDAWRGLSNIKTMPLSDADGTALTTQLRRTDLRFEDRLAMGYALGKLEEDRGRYPQAFRALSEANATLRQRAPWSAAAFNGYVEAALAATTRLPAPLDPTLGHEVIFIVGLPRSGSTLFEQILAAHPQVEGASELPELAQLIQHESMRRRQPYPAWIANATAADWQRLGRDYLQRTARWRQHHPRFTDKMPENWKHAGILRAMLPGATVIEVRRDPLETGWSCFRQQFYQLPHFACDLEDIATYLKGCEHAMDTWRKRDPQRIHLHRYEDLIADPDSRIRALLDDCALAFAPACLEPHLAKRSVRTASAAQVRQPLRSDTARAGHYGELLEPLRRGLAR